MRKVYQSKVFLVSRPSKGSANEVFNRLGHQAQETERQSLSISRFSCRTWRIYHRSRPCDPTNCSRINIDIRCIFESLQGFALISEFLCYAITIHESL